MSPYRFARLVLESGHMSEGVVAMAVELEAIRREPPVDSDYISFILCACPFEPLRFEGPCKYENTDWGYDTAGGIEYPAYIGLHDPGCKFNID